jgi:hypothetical protein
VQSCGEFLILPKQASVLNRFFEDACGKNCGECG